MGANRRCGRRADDCGASRWGGGPGMGTGAVGSSIVLATVAADRTPFDAPAVGSGLVRFGRAVVAGGAARFGLVAVADKRRRRWVELFVYYCPPTDESAIFLPPIEKCHVLCGNHRNADPGLSGLAWPRRYASAGHSLSHSAIGRRAGQTNRVGACGSPR